MIGKFHRFGQASSAVDPSGQISLRDAASSIATGAKDPRGGVSVGGSTQGSNLGRETRENADIVTDESIRAMWNDDRRRMLGDLSAVGGSARWTLIFDPGAREGRPWGPYQAIVVPPVLDSDEAIIARVDGPSSGNAFDVMQTSMVRTMDSLLRLRFDMQPRQPGEPVLRQMSAKTMTLPTTVRRITTPFFPTQWAVMRDATGAMDTSVASSGNGVLLPDGELLVARQCSPSGPEPRDAFSWQVREVPTLIAAGGRIVPGPVVPHACDLSVASWWFRIGFALVTDKRLIDALDKVDPRTGRFEGQPEDLRPGEPTGFIAQAEYMRAVAACAERGYNAANVPWHLDPVARNLYRDWFAGHDDVDFDAQRNHNEDKWFSNREDCGEKRLLMLSARVRPGAWEDMKVGEMPARLDLLWRATHAADDRKTMMFVSRSGLAVWAGDASRDPSTAREVQNRAYASSFAMGQSNWNGSTLARMNDGGDDSALTQWEKQQFQPGGAWDMNTGSAKPRAPDGVYSSDWYAQLRERRDLVDWRVGGFDAGSGADPLGVFGGTHVPGSIPLRWYLAWYREWFRTLCMDEPVSAEEPAELPRVAQGRRWQGFRNGVLPRRTAGEMLQQALSSALDINLAWASIYGGQRELLQALGEKTERFGASQPNRLVQGIGSAISGTASAAGGAIGGKLGESVGALVGAGVDFLAGLVSLAIPEYNCRGYGRDDLGRPKPVFERDSLGGDPEQGRPPSFTVPVPFGFCRGIVEIPEAPPMPTLERTPPRVPEPETGGSNLGMLLPVGLAAGGLALYGVWQWRKSR